MNVQRLISIALMLIGIVLLLQGITSIFALVEVSKVLETFKTTLAGLSLGVGQSNIPDYSMYLTLGWIFAILQLITGGITLLSGIILLKETGY
jgi:hypothetical protein